MYVDWKCQKINEKEAVDSLDWRPIFDANAKFYFPKIDFSLTPTESLTRYFLQQSEEVVEEKSHI